MRFLAQAASDVTWIERGGIIAVLVVALYISIRAFVSGKIHTDGEFKALDAAWEERFNEMREDRDWWRRAATTATRTGEQATEVASRLANGNPEVRR